VTPGNNKPTVNPGGNKSNTQEKPAGNKGEPSNQPNNPGGTKGTKKGGN
jgi:hypothetical protein